MVMVTLRGAAAIAGATAGGTSGSASGRGRPAPGTEARTRPAMPSGLSTAVATSSRPDTGR